MSGTTHATFVDVTSTMAQAMANAPSPKLIVTIPSVGLSPEPVIVRILPPAQEPEVGEMASILGTT